MLTDDLPWPELGNVSRGATRGNQGQKGFLGPPDNEGRCTLQLRVQPGVLAVRLNRQASDWYRVLDNEVNRALKLTKSYWRKARRRQDYNAEADQEHMELHEWLQQLKDKVMSHLELLMQKGEIQGPPYVVPDDVELTFLRKFIERQAAGIPHNPRLRRAFLQNNPSGTNQQHPVLSTAVVPSAPLSWSGDDKDTIDQDQAESPEASSSQIDNPQSVMDQVNSNRKILSSARAALLRAQRETQEAFALYTSCLDTESRARQQVSLAEERRDAIMTVLLEKYRTVPPQDVATAVHDSSNSGFPRSVSRASTTHSQEETMSPNLANHVSVQASVNSWKAMRGMQWPQTDSVVAAAEIAQAQGFGTSERAFASTREAEAHADCMVSFDRKHPRHWEGLQGSHTVHEGPRAGLMDHLVQNQPGYEGLTSSPPRKRMQIPDGGMFSAPRPMSSRDADRPYPTEWASQSQL